MNTNTPPHPTPTLRSPFPRNMLACAHCSSIPNVYGVQHQHRRMNMKEPTLVLLLEASLGKKTDVELCL